jgi:transketolase
MAMGYRQRGLDIRVYCLLGDGELQEGQVWEAALTAAHHKLDTVCAIVDNNHVQLDGKTGDIKCLEPVADKWRAFGWNVIEINGHNPDEIYKAYQDAIKERRRPTVIVAETIKGKGVSFMENQSAWHGTAPNQEQLHTAINEINGGISL